MPKTLFARLFILLTLVMTVSALSLAALFTFSDTEPRARQLAQLLTSIANLTRSAVVAAAPESRIELLDELSRREGIHIYIADEGEVIKVPDSGDPMLLRVEELLRESLGPDARLSLERDGEHAIFLRTLIEDDAYWIAVPLERIDRAHPAQWLGWGALVAAISLLAATAFVSRLTRPLRSIAAAARAIGAGGHPPPLAEDGPEELQAVAHAFNQMNADLNQLEQDRALILAGVSHDLRTPLTRLRMGIEMSVDDAESRDGMAADIEEMDRTIGQFLDFARADGGEAPSATRLDHLLSELTESYQRRQFPLEVRIDATPELKVQAQAMRRVMSNLIDNALRYGAGSTVEISLSAAAHAIVLDVADRGPGIPPEEAERLKRPFTRLESARSNTGGAGLGLAIVDRIVRQQGGRFDLLPREGGGLLARVTIPAP